MSDNEEEKEEEIPSQDEQEQAAWAARGWDFEEPEVDEESKKRIDDLWNKIYGTKE